MLPLSEDPSFTFELLRALAHARYGGSDIGEVLYASNQIEAGNFANYSTTFENLGDQVVSEIEGLDSKKHPVAVREAKFAASTYYRSADFFLHGNWEDPRIDSLWEKQLDNFNGAMSLVDTPGERMMLKADGFEVPAIYYSCGDGEKRPTLILGNGYDGSQEELYHFFVQSALERGWNAITYEGPGQPSVRRDQGLGFITEWEKAVTPVVDFLEERGETKMSHVVLFGLSLGGFFATRAAAFESRITAVVAIDGVYDVGEAFLGHVDEKLRELFRSGDKETVDAAIYAVLADENTPSPLRWGIGQGLWSFKQRSPFDFLTKAEEMTMEGIMDKVQVPVLIGWASNEQFFMGQPEKVAEALGDRGTLVKFYEDAGEHCQMGASVKLNRVMYEWFDRILGEGK